MIVSSLCCAALTDVLHFGETTGALTAVAVSPILVSVVIPLHVSVKKLSIDCVAWVTGQ